MHKIYTRRGSGAAAVEMLLDEFGLSYERIEVPRGQENVPAEMRRINPRGEVPVLVLPDGTVMTESAAMCIYLADLHPEAGLAPAITTPERATYLRWMTYLAVNVYGTFMHVYHADKYHDDPATHAGIRAKAIERLAEDWATLEAALDPGPYLLGSRISAADIYLTMFPYWDRDRAGLFQRAPQLAKLCQLVLDRPAVASAWAYHAADM